MERALLLGNQRGDNLAELLSVYLLHSLLALQQAASVYVSY